MKLTGIKALILSILLCAHGAHAQVEAPAGLIPAGLSPGDTFFVVFRTDAGTNANQTSAALEAFADAQAAAGANTGMITGWTALMAHIDGTITTTSAFAGITDRPIYRVDGVLVANDRTSMFSGPLLQTITVNQNGDVPSSSDVWTGFLNNGNAADVIGIAAERRLGQPTGMVSRYGVSNNTTFWASAGDRQSTFSQPLYVLSPLMVVPDNDNLPDLLECPSFPNDCPDRDMDGTPDFQDADSDGDNIPDIVEALALLDDDNDGIGNGLDIDDMSVPNRVDANNDGIDDRMPIDSDGDGIANHLDTDSDNDGINDDQDTPLDVTSFGMADTDSDGIDDLYDVNHSTVTGATNVDADGDGYDDGVIATLYSEANPTADADDIPDLFDADQNNTAGTADLSGDSDGDGLSDLTECPVFSLQASANCPDSDADGVPDYQDAASSSSSSGGSLGPWILIALLLLAVLRKRHLRL